MMDFNYIFLQEFGYILAAILFIFGLKMLGQESSAARGNLVSSIGMFLAILVTVTNIINPILVLIAILLGGSIGALFALRVKMTSIPEMVALFNGFGGLSSFFLAWSEFTSTSEINILILITSLTVFIGGVTFSGSVIAFLKLSESLKSSPVFLDKFSRVFLITSFIYLGFFTVTVLMDLFNFGPILLAISDGFIVLLIVSILAGIFFVLPMPGYIFGLGYLFYSIYSMKRVNDNIGHEAHLGGAIAGFFTTIFISPMIVITNSFTVLILLIPIVYFYIKSKSV